MKRLLTLSTFLLLSIMTFASTEVDGIYYEFAGTEATVVSGANKYTGDVIIPASVTNGNQNYSVTRIYQNAFYGCTGLTSVTIPSSVTNIGTSAFEGCTGLETVTNNSSISIIEDRTFYGCKSLTSASILNDVTSIGMYAFSGCSSLTSIIIPNNLTNIGKYAFDRCPGLTSIKVEEGHPIYDSRGNCNAIIKTSSNTLVAGCKNTIIPNTVTSIEQRAFYGCSGLTSIVIPNSIYSMGPSAFYGCTGLTSVTIPNSVTSIGSEAFYNCSGLVSIYSYIENPTSATGSNLGYDIYTNATLYVLKGKKDEYLATDGWKNFVKITEFAPTYTLTYKVDDETYKTYQVEYGTTIVPEPAPTKDGYTFSGWSEIPTTMPARDVTVTGTFTAKYTLTYKVDGEVYKQYEVAEGDAITPEPAPTKEGYSFSGWSEIPATMPANDVTIIGTFAQNPTETESAFVDVSALGIDDQELHEISAGTTLCESSSVSMSNAYDDSFSAVSMAISDVQNYQVNINGKKYIYGEGVRGATNAKPYSIGECQEDGTFVGGQYEGWVYKFTTLYDGYLYVPCRITTNKSIYVWAGNADEAAGRLVAYNYRGITSDGQLASVSLPSNSDDYYVGPNEEYDLYDRLQTIQSIDKNLIVEGSSLWTNGVIAFPVKASVGTYYVCATGTKLHSNGFVFVPGAKDIGEVVFSPRTFTLTYQVDGETYRTYELAEGDVITPEAAPTKEGYTFSGWSEIPETMPANDVTVIGTFTAIPEPSSDNALAISNAETYAGKQIVLPIDMNNVASIKAFQFDLYLPEGITIAKDEDEEDMIELTTRAAKSHTIAYSNRPDGAIRMVCTSMSGATFKGNEGTIVNVTLDVAPSMTDGDYDIEIKNIELSDGTPYNPADIKATLTVKTYTPGDVDGTGTVSVNDAVCVINYILGSPAEDFIEPAADLDGNGVITVNDVVILINDYILGGNSQNSLDLAFLQEATADDDYLYIEEDNLSNMTVGEEREIEVFMNTSRTDIQGLQCDIYLPDGMEFVPEEDGDEKYYADKGGRAAKSHSVAAQLMADGSVRVVETSTSGAKFKANELAVFYFTVRATANTAYGKGIRLCNMELSYGGAPINPEDRTFDVNVKAGTVTLNKEGYATFSYASDVAIEGAETYTAELNGSIVRCTQVEDNAVPAYNGVILKGEPNATVTLYTNTGVEDYTGNELKATTTADGLADIETALVLSDNMFKNYTGAAFEADKAYIPYSGNSGSALYIVFSDDDATSIDGISAVEYVGPAVKTVEDGKLVIRTANGKYNTTGAKIK